MGPGKYHMTVMGGIKREAGVYKIRIIDPSGEGSIKYIPVDGVAFPTFRKVLGCKF